MGAEPRTQRSRINTRASATSAVTKFSFQLASITTTAGSEGVQGMMLRPDQLSVITNLAKQYQFWRVRSMHLKWYPFVGATTGGNVRIAGFNNPEIISYAINNGYTAGEVQSLVGTSPFNRGFAAYLPFEFNVPAELLNRKRWYSYDSSALGSVEAADRTASTVFLTYIGGAASTTYGFWTGSAVFEFKDFFYGATVVPLLLASQPDEYFQAPDGTWYHRHDGVIDMVDGPPT